MSLIINFFKRKSPKPYQFAKLKHNKSEKLIEGRIIAYTPEIIVIRQEKVLNAKN